MENGDDVQSNLIPRGGQPTKGRIDTTAEVLQRGKGSKPHTGIPRPGVLHWKDEPLKYLALKASGDHLQQTQRAVENRGSALKGHTQRLTWFSTQDRSSNLKEAWSRPTCWSWGVSQRIRRQVDLILVTQTPAAAIMGSSFYHVDTGAGKYSFGILSSLLALEPRPTLTQWCVGASAGCLRTST